MIKKKKKRDAISMNEKKKGFLNESLKRQKGWNL